MSLPHALDMLETALKVYGADATAAVLGCSAQCLYQARRRRRINAFLAAGLLLLSLMTREQVQEALRIRWEKSVPVNRKTGRHHKVMCTGPNITEQTS